MQKKHLENRDANIAHNIQDCRALQFLKDISQSHKS